MKAHYTKKQIKVANVLASFFGMKDKNNATKAKRHLMKTANKNGIDKQGIIDLIPLAKEIVRQRAVDFIQNKPTAKVIL